MTAFLHWLLNVEGYGMKWTDASSGQQGSGETGRNETEEAQKCGGALVFGFSADAGVLSLSAWGFPLFFLRLYELT